MNPSKRQPLFESLESRRLYSATAAATTKTIHEVAASRFTTDLGKATPYSPVVTTANVTKRSTTFSFIAIIHWGDGKTSAGKAVEQSDGSYDIEGTHTYAKTGKFNIAVYIARMPTGSGPQPQFIELYNSLHDQAIVSTAS